MRCRRRQNLLWMWASQFPQAEASPPCDRAEDDEHEEDAGEVRRHQLSATPVCRRRSGRRWCHRAGADRREARSSDDQKSAAELLDDGAADGAIAEHQQRQPERDEKDTCRISARERLGDRVRDDVQRKSEVVSAFDAVAYDATDAMSSDAGSIDRPRPAAPRWRRPDRRAMRAWRRLRSSQRAPSGRHRFIARASERPCRRRRARPSSDQLDKPSPSGRIAAP